MTHLYKSTTITGNFGTLELSVPLQKRRPGRGGKVYTKISEDGTKMQKIRVGSGVHDMLCVLRYEQDVTDLMDMLIAGIEEGETLTYTHSDSSTHDFIIVEPKTIKEIKFEEEWQRTEGWFRQELRLRKTNGNRWDSILQVKQ